MSLPQPQVLTIRSDYTLSQLMWLPTALDLFNRGRVLTAWIPFVEIRKRDREHAFNCGTAVSGLCCIELLTAGDDSCLGRAWNLVSLQSHMTH